MSPHIDEDVGRLLRGEASRTELLGAAAHLRGCGDCRDALISALVAHTSLTSAAAYLSRPSPAGSLPDLQVIPFPLPLGDSESVSGLDSEVESDGGSNSEPDSNPQSDPIPQRDALDGPRRNDAAHRAPSRPESNERSDRPARRRHPGRWLVAAAVAVAVLATGSTLLRRAEGSGSGRTVALAPYDNGTTVSGSARVTNGDEITLDASRLPAPAAGTLYEVWLTNAGRTTMYPIGSLPADRRGAFTVAANLVRAYTAIEVSVQAVNTSAYSGLSLLRGDYG